jgi:ABC-type branched-subunit amino acid transport system substrate-binding protein
MTGDWPIGRTVIGAVSLAVDDVNNDPGLLPGRKLEYAPVRDDACNKLKALESLSTIFDVDGPIDFVIGPGCSGGCISTATLAQAKGLAQISPFCGSGALSNKKEYPVFMRTTSPYSKWGGALLALMGWANWGSVALLRDQSELMALSAQTMRNKLEEHAKQVVVEVRYISQGDLPSMLQRIEHAGARVVMALAYSTDYLAIAVAAKMLTFTEGWAWIGVDMVADADTIGEAFGNVVTRQDAQAALQGWIYMEPYSDAPASFFDRVRKASIEVHGQKLGENDPVNSFASNLYDAILLYAHIVTSYPELVEKGPSDQAEKLMNFSFQGLGGGVIQLDQDGDKKESIRVLNYGRRKDGRIGGRQVGVYDAIKVEYMPDNATEVLWPGHSSVFPLDKRGSEKVSTQMQLIIAGVLAGVLVIMFVIAAAFLLKNKKRGNSDPALSTSFVVPDHK